MYSGIRKKGNCFTLKIRIPPSVPNVLSARSPSVQGTYNYIASTLQASFGTYQDAHLPLLSALLAERVGFPPHLQFLIPEWGTHHIRCLFQYCTTNLTASLIARVCCCHPHPIIHHYQGVSLPPSLHYLVQSGSHVHFMGCVCHLTIVLCQGAPNKMKSH